MIIIIIINIIIKLFLSWSTVTGSGPVRNAILVMVVLQFHTLMSESESWLESVHCHKDRVCLERDPRWT